MDIVLFLAMLVAVGLSVRTIFYCTERFQQEQLAPIHCRACDRELSDSAEYKPLGYGVYVCIECFPDIEGEVKAVVPYWFEHPLVNGEPAQEPAPQLPPQDSTTYQCYDCHGEHPQHTMCPELTKTVTNEERTIERFSKLSYWKNLTVQEQNAWIIM